jgi:hypothetical protein
MTISKNTYIPSLPLNFNDTRIERVKSHCHLGLWLTENMSWEKHIGETSKKVSPSLNLFKRMSHQIDRKTKLFIYRCYIRPKLEYATCVFGCNLTKGQIDSLEDIQRQALLSAVNAYRHTSHNKLLQESGFEPLMIRRKYFGLCHLYRIIHRQTPDYLTNLLPQYVHERAQYALRNAYDFSIPRVAQNYIRLSFFWSSLHHWNALDLDIRQAPSLNNFKKRLKLLYFHQGIKLYDVLTDRNSVHHARMRMGLSGLNDHRKKYNFISLNNCPLCGKKPENTVHYFLRCPYLAVQRNVLIGDITQLLTARLPDLELYPTTSQGFNALVSIFLYGSSSLSFDENISLFKSIHTFIRNSKRFEIN